MPPYMVLGYTAVMLKHQFKEDTAKCVILILTNFLMVVIAPLRTEVCYSQTNTRTHIAYVQQDHTSNLTGVEYVFGLT